MTRARSSPRAPRYGPDALDVATVVKLIRNALMAPLLLLIARSGRRPCRRGGAGSASVGAGIRRAVPLFVFGFLALAGAPDHG